jgi:hypothetical protein
MLTLLQKMRHNWGIKKIEDIADLKNFLYSYSAKNSGQIIVKYAQKRLGKIHYNLTRENEDYNQELIRCQITIHAEILADLGHLIARLSKIENVKQSKKLQQSIIEAHTIYVTSSPDWYEGEEKLTEQHFNRAHQELKELSIHTGKILFHLLPMTENLRKSNILIFQNQIRLVYIQFLEQLGKRITIDKLTTLIQN